jgi:hypothetical protein
MRKDVTSHLGTIAIAVLSLAIPSFVSVPCWADNPIVQTSYTADPAPMVYEGRLYLYTSHDEDVSVGNFYTMNDWHLYSTVDMVNWTDHGTPAGYKTFKWGTDNAWAPQGIARNGKFYLYVPLNNNTGARVGVGVATNPAGPFTDPIGKELVANGSMAIDPTVFVDDDGQAHLYWGNGNLRYVKLNSDMISTSGSVISNIAMTGFVEGPWFYKRGSLYYLVYAAGSGSEKISYATSNAPAGPWTYRGDVMAPGTIYTNHPGVVDYKEHSYFFYHNGALPGGGSYKRSVCVEEFTYGADGSIPKLKPTKTGPTAIATLDPFKQVEAETIANSSGLKTEACTDTGGGVNVTSISNGDYIKVKDVDFLDGVTSFDARVSSSGSNAKIELYLDSQTGTPLGTCDVSGISSWTTKTCSVTGGSGKHDLFLKFTGGSGDLFKFNWWKFSGPTKPIEGTGGSSGLGGNGGSSGLGGNGGSSLVQGTGGSATSSGGRTAESSGGTASTQSAISAGGTSASSGPNSNGGAFAPTNGGSSGSFAVRTTAISGAGTVGTGTVESSTSSDDDSCSCRVQGSRGNGGSFTVFSIIAAAFLRLRRGSRAGSRLSRVRRAP